MTSQLITNQWNQFETSGKDGMVCEVVDLTGHNGDSINAYVARPTGDGPFPGVVLAHHLPGWDEFYREMTRRFAQHGYAAISPNFYAHFGYGTPDDAAARARGQGGMSDDQVVADSQAGAAWLRAQPNSNGKVGIIGTCSGGRHSFVVACRTDDFNAVVDCWGGGVVAKDEDLTPQRPVSALSMTKDLNVPLLGLFGNDDQNPSPEQVNQHEEELKQHGKQYEFHRYDGAGHGIFYYQTPLYRPQPAMDCWSKIFAFFAQHLA
jgi:carboxymethylenebutenolidase